MNCIMTITHVLDDDEFSDLVMRNQIAQVFLFFLPGMANKLKSVALLDEKYGHKVPKIALKTWGRIVALIMRNYNPTERKIELWESTEYQISDKKLQTEAELKEYIRKTERSPKWYKEHDKKLHMIIVEFTKLVHHSHPSIRLELVDMATLLLENCIDTMPTSITCLIDIVIILSEDDDDSVSVKSKQVLGHLSCKLPRDEFKSLLDNLEENFYTILTSIPRKFNAVGR